METGKTGKYFKYAIGEILLVVIGILIALHINNWNEQRINKQKERQILEELHKEFVDNKKQFDSVVYYHRRTFRSANYVKSRLPLDLSVTNLDSLAHHLYYMGWYYTFNPSRGVTNSLINSATFNLISNDELRNLLISWNDVLTDYQEEELVARDNYLNILKPFEKKHFYWDRPHNWLNDKRIDITVLTSLAFDNYVSDRHNDLNNLIVNPDQELELVGETINKIINLSKPNGND